MRILVISGSIALLVCGCASNSGIIPTGADTYMVSRQAATGFSGLGTLKADALEEATQYCLRENKNLHVISATEAEPPFIFGNFPKANVQFKCVDVATEDTNTVTADTSDQAKIRKDVYDELLKLNDLRERGILTDAEFDAEKKKLLKAD